MMTRVGGWIPKQNPDQYITPFNEKEIDDFPSLTYLIWTDFFYFFFHFVY